MTGRNSQDKDAEDPIKMKDDEKPSKFLRVITVSAYLFSVSFAALMLSLYYIFIWSKFLVKLKCFWENSINDSFKILDPDRSGPSRLEGDDEGTAALVSSTDNL